MSLSFRRPPFDVAGRVVARREITLSKVYRHGDEVPEAEGLTPRLIAIFWEQGLVDTLSLEPTDAELERLTAPRAPAKATQPPRR